MTHGARCGVGFAQKAAIGRLLVFVLMIVVSAMGLSVVLTTSAAIFGIVKLVGAAYLIWLGIALWRNSKLHESIGAEAEQITQSQGFKAAVALSNPKAIIIFAAFFPQFVDANAYWHSYLLLGSAFLFMEVIAISVYASMGRFSSKVASDRLPLMQRLSGLTMCIFGVLLLASPQPSPK